MSQYKINFGIRHLMKGSLFFAIFVFLTGEATNNDWHVVALPPEQHPQLLIDESINPDFETLARETWELFMEVFQSRSDCFGDVYLKASTRLNSRAAYDPDTATVTVKVPGTIAMLQSALIHEWAHHVEFQCEAHQELRPEFLLATGLPIDTPWPPDNITENTPANIWAQIPSEHYAEATIELVLGERQIPTNIHVTGEEIQVIKDWVSSN